MPRPKAMQNITRIDYERKHQHGWWVRLQREGQQIQSFFSDAANGGKLGALLKAQRYRDKMLRIYPPPEHGNMFNRTSSRNTSGKPGVHRTRSMKRGHSYDVWQASWSLPNGKHISKKFHFSPEGRSEREAKRLAIEARAEGLRMIEEMRRKMKQREAKKAAAKKR